MRDITFGQYYPGNSPIHKLDARVKIIFSLFYMVGVFFAKSFSSFAVLIVFNILMVLVGRLPMRTILKSLKPILFLAIFALILNVFFSNSGGYMLLQAGKYIKVTLEGIRNAIFMVIRLILLVVGTSVLTLTTTPTELTDAIESLLSPLKILKVPVHDFAIIMSLALRFVPSFIDETDKIIMAQKARGASFDNGPLHKRAKAYIPVLIPLFVNAFRKADDLADALDARCYSATPNRTKMKVQKITYREIVASIIIIAFFTIVFLDYSQIIPFQGYDQRLLELIKRFIEG